MEGKPLTHQQERFAQEVASGKSQAEAYRIAYPRSLKWKPATVWESASRAMADRKVAARVDVIREELAQKGLWTREDSARALIGVINKPDKASDVVAAVKALNDMHGYDAPKEIKHSGEVTAITRRIVDSSGT